MKNLTNNNLLNLTAMKTNNKEYKLYLSYINDFLTLSGFCEYYNLSEKKALKIILKYKNL